MNVCQVAALATLALEATPNEAVIYYGVFKRVVSAVTACAADRQSMGPMSYYISHGYIVRGRGYHHSIVAVVEGETGYQDIAAGQVYPVCIMCQQKPEICE